MAKKGKASTDPVAESLLHQVVFAGRWGSLACPVARLDLKWSASVCCSSIPEELFGLIRPPWSHFVIELPRGLGFTFLINDVETPMASVCVSRLSRAVRSRVAGIVDGWSIRPYAASGRSVKQAVLTDEQLFSGMQAPEQAPSPCTRTTEMLGPLIGAVCMAFNSGGSQKLSGRSDAARRARGARYPTRNEYMVGRPVVVDLTERVRSHIEGVIRGSLKVQGIVRGHWKNQPHGTGSTQRKFIHVEPYWRGPEDAPIIIRPHDL